MRSAAPSPKLLLVVASALIGTLLVVVALTSATASPESRTLPSVAVTPVLVVAEPGGPDALVALPAAAVLGGPLVLVPDTGISAEVRRDLLELDPARIVVVGGPGAVSDAIATELQGFTAGTVRRMAGDDRYATAARVATSAFLPPVDRVVITIGEGTADEVRGAHRAGPGSPVLLVDRDRVPSDTAAALLRLRPRNITVLGDQDEVSEAVVQRLWGYIPRGGVVTRGAHEDGPAAAAG